MTPPSNKKLIERLGSAADYFASTDIAASPEGQRHLASIREAASALEEREGLEAAVNSLDAMALSAWRVREVLHLNLIELCKGLDPATGKNLIDAVNDLNEHLPLSEDGFTWRTPAVRSALNPTPVEEGGLR